MHLTPAQCAAGQAGVRSSPLVTLPTQPIPSTRCFRPEPPQRVVHYSGSAVTAASPRIATQLNRHTVSRSLVLTQAVSSSASPLPASMAEAVQTAAQCVCNKLKPMLTAGKGPKKGFAAAAPVSKQILYMEIPTADQSPAALSQLALDTASALSSSLGNASNPMVIVCANPDVATALSNTRGKPSGSKVMNLRDACRLPRLEGAVLLLVAPAVSDVALCQQLTDETWAGQGVVLVNAEFMSANTTTLGLTAELETYIQQISTAYCIMPVAVKGLLGNKEGMIMRQATGKAVTDGGVWRILMKAPGNTEQYLQIGQSKKRPSSDDIQLAFINANASESPLTKLVSKIKGK